MNAKTQKYLILTILFLLIIPGNYFSIQFFESVDFIFGNIPVFIIALLFHPVWAAAAGLISALLCSLSCGHYMEVPIFVLEALFLSLAVYRKKTGIPLILISLYWLLLGIPLTFLLFLKLLNLPMLLILLRVEIYFLNALFAAAAANAVLASAHIQKLHMVRRLRLNRFFNIISSFLVILVMAVVFILLSLDNRIFMDRNIDYSSELLLNSSENLESDIESLLMEYREDPREMGIQLREGKDPGLNEELQFLLEYHRKDKEHSITLKDSNGRLIVSASESSSFLPDHSELIGLSEGTLTSLDRGISLWIPSLQDYRSNIFFESRFVYIYEMESSGWIIQAELSLHEMMYSHLSHISLILFLISVVSLLMIPVLKLMSKRFSIILDSLILQSSRYMYGLDDPGEHENWPDSRIWEFSHLSYRLKEIMSHQTKATSLLSKQNKALSDLNSALARSEENLRITLNSIADGVLVSDAEGRLLSINSVASRLCGYKKDFDDYVFLQNILKLKDEFTGEFYTGFLDAVLHKGEVIDSAARYLIENRNGKVSVVTIGAAPIRMSPNSVIRGAVIILRDITESRELEEQLRQSQKMEIVGQLAGGIAHDFNNLLGGIQGMISVMKLDLEDVSDQSARLGEITKLITRASDLTSKLLSFSRKGKMVSSSFDFHSIIDETRDLLLHIFPGNIKIECELKASESHIQGDPTEIQRVLMNLALNARDAIQGEGILKYSTVNLAGGTQIETLTGPVRLETDFFYIRVSDTGSGIPADIINHVFEPFFSTKDLGQGSGLGLSAVYGSLLEHHGYIHLESAEGKGTVFSLYYPLADLIEKQLDD